MSLLDVFAPVQTVADAVLYEGYVLYPYRASADKNRLRWQWGIVGPPGSRADGVGEDDTMATDVVVEGDDALLRFRLRFLRVVSRRVERRDGADWVRVPSVEIDGTTHVSFDDTEERSVDATPGHVVGFELPDRTEIEALNADHRLVRRREAISGELTVDADRRRPEVSIVHVAVRNTTAWPGGDRDDANLRSLIGAHVLGAVDRGLFVSTLDPPAGLDDVAAGCQAQRLWPVLVGATQRASLVLASPIILYDQPEIAPESQGTFYDGLEIDEMLSLRVMTMTDAEKTEARATDPRSAAIVDRVDAMSDGDFAGLHGTIRTETTPWWDPGTDARFDPDSDGVVVAGEAISRGSVVRLHPGKRADAHDLFYRDRVATVAAIIHDVDGSVHVAVTIDDDPAADLNDATGRYLYFAPDEVEPLGRRVDR